MLRNFKKTSVVSLFSVTIGIILVLCCKIEYTNTVYQKKYSDNILLYKEIVSKINYDDDFDFNNFKSPDINFSYEWQSMLIDIKSNIQNSNFSSFGYYLTDINNDEKPEMIWVRDKNTVLAIYTVKKDKVRMIGAYYSKKKAIINSKYQIYTLSTGGAHDFVYTVETLDFDGDLIILKKFGMNDGNFFEYVASSMAGIDSNRFYKLLEDYPYKFTDKFSESTYYTIMEKSNTQ